MPWSIEMRDGKHCVVKDADGEVEGCHDTHEKALAQQRALYANESSMSAGLEIDTTALMEEFFPDPEPQPLRIEVAAAPNEANESLIAVLNALSDRLFVQEEWQTKLGEALLRVLEQHEEDRTQFSTSLRELTASLNVEKAPPVVNVTVPDPVVNVTVPEPVVNITVPAPEVSVNLPPSRRSIKLERDAFGAISGASVEEE